MRYSQAGSHASCPQEKKTTYFKLTLPNSRNELKLALWASRTPEQFLLHVHTVIHACKQMGLDANFIKDKVAREPANLDLDIVKTEYCSNKKQAKEHQEKGDAPIRSRPSNTRKRVKTDSDFQGYITPPSS